MDSVVASLTDAVKRPSSWAAALTWGVSGFMAQPTFASFLVHFCVMPIALGATVLLARRET